jgi:hypothetical protein
VRKGLISLLIGSLLLLPLQGVSAITPKTGASCSKFKLVLLVGNYKFNCIKSGRKLVWSRTLVVTKPTPAPSPLPEPTSTTTPTPTPTASSTQSSARVIRNSVALAVQKILDKAASSTAKFSGKVTWDFSGNPSPVEKQGTIDGFMNSINSYTKLGIPTSDTILINVDSMDSLYAELTKYHCSFSKENLPTRAGFFLPNNCDGGQGVVTAFIWDVVKWPVESFDFQTILTHEYFHQIQQLENRNMGNANFPKWFWEGGAVFFSGLSYSIWNTKKTYEANLQENFSGEKYKSVLDEPCRKATIEELSDINTPTPKQSCAYSKGAMLVEYFVASFGIDNYLKIIRENSDPDWHNFGKVFNSVTNVNLDDFYKDASMFLTSRGWETSY